MQGLNLEELIAHEHLAKLQREAARKRLVRAAQADRQSRYGLLHGWLGAYSRRVLSEVRRMMARGQRQQPDVPC